MEKTKNIQLPGKLYKLACYLVLLLLLTGDSIAQLSENKEKGLLVDLVSEYIHLCRNVDLSEIKLARFANLFVRNIKIPYDFRLAADSFDLPDRYYDDMGCYLWDNQAVVQIDTIIVGGDKRVLYGKKEGEYYAWIKKEYRYVYNDTGQNNHQNWVLLHIKSMAINDSLKITGVELVANVADSDNDQIADIVDSCLTSAAIDTVNLNGCTEGPVVLISPRDSLLTPSEPDSILPATPSGTHMPSPFAFEFSMGNFSPALLSTSYSNHQLLDYNTTSWAKSGGLASPLGYSLGFSVHYQYRKWIGALVGYQGSYNHLMGEELLPQIKNYLGLNKILYNDVNIVARGYHMQLLYAGLSATYNKGKRHSIRADLLAGGMFTGFLSPNKIQMTVNYPDGPSDQELSLAFSPFIIGGIKINYQFALGPYKRFSLLLAGEYIHGKSKAESNNLTFTKTPGEISISSPVVKWPGVTVGLRYNPTKKG